MELNKYIVYAQDIFDSKDSRFSWYFLIITYVAAFAYYRFFSTTKSGSFKKDALAFNNFFNGSAFVDFVIFTVSAFYVTELLFGINLDNVYSFGSKLGQYQYPGLFPQAADTLIIQIIWPVFRLVVGDLGYYAYHRLMHSCTSLWFFHAVHHSAQRLNFLTAYRMHPVDAIISNFILGLTGGAFGAMTILLFGKKGMALMIYGFLYYMPLRAIVANLRHSHVWMTFPNWIANIVATPAQHQMHHHRHISGINYVNDCAFIDRAFGTLYLPTDKDYEELVIGIDEKEHNLNPASYWSCLVQPFVNLYHHWRVKLFQRATPGL